MDKDKSFPISGEEGFDRFTTEICSGNKERAFSETRAILNLSQLEALKWKRAHSLKAKNLFEEVEKTLEQVGKKRSNKKNLSKTIGDLRREKGKLIETLVKDDTLKNVFKNEGIIFPSDAFPRNKKLKLHASYLSSKQQKNPAYKVNDQGHIEREIDVLMLSQSLNGPAIVIEMKYTLHLKHIDKLLSTLEIINLMDPEYKNRKFRGALVFYEVENSEAMKRADQAGLYLIQITQAEVRQVNHDGFQFASFGSSDVTHSSTKEFKEK